MVNPATSADVSFPLTTYSMTTFQMAQSLSTPDDVARKGGLEGVAAVAR